MNKGNRALCLFCALCILSVSPAWANASKELPSPAGGDDITTFPAKYDETLKKLAKMIPEIKVLPLSQEHYKERDDNYQSISIKELDFRQSYEFPSDHTSIAIREDTGEIVHIKRNIVEWASWDFPSDALAKEKASDFLTGILGKNASQYRMNDQVTSTSALSKSVPARPLKAVDTDEYQRVWSTKQVHFQRLVNGIPLIGQGEITISVMANGQIQDYFASPVKTSAFSSLPAQTGKLSEGAAKQAFADALDMRLLYNSEQPVSEDRTQTKPVAKYEPTFYAIDAKTGQLIEPWTKGKQAEKKETYHLQGKGQQLSATSYQEAVALLQNIFSIDVSELRPSSHTWYRENSRRKQKEMFWNTEFDSPQTSFSLTVVSLTLDDQTGRVDEFAFANERKTGASITEATARQKALRFLENYLDPKATDIEIGLLPTQLANTEQAPEWVDKKKLAADLSRKTPLPFMYEITVKQNGIELQNEHVTIGVNHNGEIAAFHRDTANHVTDLPASISFIPLDAAKQAYVDKVKLELAYVWPEFMGQRAPAPTLAYVPVGSTANSYVDAVSGEVIAEYWQKE